MANSLQYQSNVRCASLRIGKFEIAGQKLDDDDDAPSIEELVGFVYKFSKI